VIRKAIISKIRDNGFTVIELMIVAAIIAILVVIGIPNILRQRMASNEAAALAGLKAINSACALYYSNNDAYPRGLSDLIEPQSSPPYIDAELAGGQKQGYEFIYQVREPAGFSVNANPVSPGVTGGRYFFIDERGVIHSNQNQPAGPDDPIVS
jgi:prepilin-type N-terminal cleavage/methylation domain-containing protein